MKGVTKDVGERETQEEKNDVTNLQRQEVV